LSLCAEGRWAQVNELDKLAGWPYSNIRVEHNVSNR
jgi:hypothetical protein